jgi:hypothetical protein
MLGVLTRSCRFALLFLVLLLGLLVSVAAHQY